MIIKRLMLLAGLIFLASICQSAKTTNHLNSLQPLQEWNLNNNVFSASIDKEQKSLAVLTSRYVNIISLDKTQKPQQIKISKLEHGNIILNDNIIYIGDGDDENGALIFINKMDNSINKITSNFYETNSMAISYNKHILITGHGNGEIIFFNMLTGKIIRRLGDYDAEIFALDVSPDGNKVYSGDAHGDIKVWELDTGKKLKSSVEREEIKNGIFTLKNNETQNTIISDCGFGLLCLFDNKEISLKNKIQLADEVILDCDFNTNNKIICGMTDGYVVSLNQDGTRLKTNVLCNSGRCEQGRSDDVEFVKFINNGQNIITVRKNGIVELWDSKSLLQ